MCATCCNFRKENQNNEEGQRNSEGNKYFFLSSYPGFEKHLKVSDIHYSEVNMSVGL